MDSSANEFSFKSTMNILLVIKMLILAAKLAANNLQIINGNECKLAIEFY